MPLTSLRSSHAVTNAALAGALAALLAWLGPPGTDFPAHLFQVELFRAHGFGLWNNAWYAGHYTFVGYSLLYYPLAALVGIRLLAVLSIAAAAGLFTELLRSQWGSSSVWAARSYTLVGAATMVGAAFPYALGLSFALAALVALARARIGLFAILLAAAAAASPLAFVFALVAAAAAAPSRPRAEIIKPAAALLAICGLGVLAWRLFPDPGSYPFPWVELVGALCFALAGAALCRKVEGARVLWRVFVVYGVLCLASFAIPSNLGGNIARLRLAALPLALLVVSLRRWRPLPLSVLVVGLALGWNASPLLTDFQRSDDDPSATRAYWQPVIAFLERSLTPSYRVEVVATADHWEAVYLPESGISIARGWFRQDDFPVNRVLYGPLTPERYRTWLGQLGVRYVVLTNAALDYSSHSEAALLRSGASGLPVVFRAGGIRVYELSPATPILSGPSHPRVEELGANTIVLALARAGRYRLAVRYSPYLEARGGCVRERADGMTELFVARPGTVRLAVTFSASGAFAALTGRMHGCRATPAGE